MVYLLWRIIWQFLKKLNMHLSSEPIIPLLGTDSRTMRTSPHKNLYMNVHCSIIHNGPQSRDTIQMFIN